MTFGDNKLVLSFERDGLHLTLVEKKGKGVNES
jgi:hypothetical protein